MTMMEQLPELTPVARQLIGLLLVAASTGAMIARYGVPRVSLGMVYLLFGAFFVAIGVVVGQARQSDLITLLVLRDWGVNLSFMGIGYSVALTGVAGLVRPAVRRFLPRSCGERGEGAQ